MINQGFQDFVIELTTWFRRVIWFLGFTAATTASIPLFLLTGALAPVFEVVYSVTNARMYWQQEAEDMYLYGGFSGESITFFQLNFKFFFLDHSDVGNINFVDRMIRIGESQKKLLSSPSPKSKVPKSRPKRPNHMGHHH